jgi:23S rRNA maturation mini-RNase III
MRDYDDYRRKLEGLRLPSEDIEFLLDVLRQYEEEIVKRGGDAKPGTDDRAT